MINNNTHFWYAAIVMSKFTQYGHKFIMSKNISMIYSFHIVFNNKFSYYMNIFHDVNNYITQDDTSM